MKTTRLLALLSLSLAATGAAFAQEATYDYPQPIAAGKTRDQVQNELFAARADGSIKVWSTSYNPLAVAKSLKSRDQVKAERDPAYAATYNGEDSGSFALSRQPRNREAAPMYAHSAK